MDNSIIDNLTIAQAREIASIFGSAQPAQPTAQQAPIASIFLGQRVIVRSNQSGVWFGTLSVAHPDGQLVLEQARRAHYWTGAGSCSGLAITGPTGGRIAGAVAKVAIEEYVEIVECTPAACAQWDSLPVWTGR